MNVAVVGASPNPERYANRAIRMLREYEHDVVPVNPGHQEIEGLPVAHVLDDLEPGSVHTVTMYVGPERSGAMRDALVRLKPERVIFNPGAEHASLAEHLKANGIATTEACTLVLLRTGDF